MHAKPERGPQNMSSTFLYGGSLRANGIRQHFLRYGGTGAVIVILPGITSPAITWGFVAEQLGREFDVYVLDARGRGLSDRGSDYSYDMGTYADDVQAFVEAANLGEWTLLGHSMGGRMGLVVGARRPDGLQAMALIDPPLSGPGRRVYGMQLSWYLDSMRLSAEGCDGEAIRPFLPRWSADALQLRAEWLHTCDEKAVVDSFHALRTDDVIPAAGRIVVPTLLMIAGDVDVIRPEEAAEMASLIPDLNVTTIPGAGHMIPWENLDGFFDGLMPFLRRASK